MPITIGSAATGRAGAEAGHLIEPHVLAIQEMLVADLLPNEALVGGAIDLG